MFLVISSFRTSSDKEDVILSTEPPPAFKEPDALVSNQHLHHEQPETKSLISNLYISTRNESLSKHVHQ